MKDYYVYGLFEPGSNEIFYVGKGKGNRCYQHLSPTHYNGPNRNSMLYRKIRKMLASGIRPIVQILVPDLEEEEAYEREAELITLYGRRDRGDGPLCNHTDGGRGTKREHLLGKKRSKSGRERIARSNVKVKGHKIQCFDLATGKAIKTFDSIRQAMAEGHALFGIKKFINGRKKEYNLMGWRYVE